MALSFVESSAWVSSVNTVQPTLPTGTVAGDLMIMFLVSKYDDATLASQPSGWTDLGTAVNTGRSTGNDNGNLRGRAWYKIYDGSEAMPTLAPSPNNVSAVHITSYRVASGMAFSVAGNAPADDLPGSPLSLTTSAGIDVTTNDIVHVDMVLNGDVVTWGTTTISSTGITFGTMVTNVADGTTTSGTDLRWRSVRRPVSSGTASNTITASTTLAGTTTNAVGVGLISRIREVLPTLSTIPFVHPVNRSIHILGR